MALGKNVKRIRESLGLKQSDLSEKTGGVVSQPAISNLETRDSKSSEFAAILAVALGVSIDELFQMPSPKLKVQEPTAGYNIDKLSTNIVHDSALSTKLSSDTIKIIEQLDMPSIAMLESLIKNFSECDKQGKEHLAFSGETAKSGSEFRKNAKLAEDKKQQLKGLDNANSETTPPDQRGRTSDTQ